jgi:hypothetical protein
MRFVGGSGAGTDVCVGPFLFFSCISSAMYIPLSLCDLSPFVLLLPFMCEDRAVRGVWKHPHVRVFLVLVVFVGIEESQPSLSVLSSGWCECASRVQYKSQSPSGIANRFGCRHF